MTVEMTPHERRATARELADTLSNDDLLRDEVYALLDISPEGLSGDLLRKLETSRSMVRSLTTEIKNLEGKIDKIKSALED